MDIREAQFDPMFARMREAFRGDPGIWTAVSRSMRDAMVSHAVENCPYYAGLLGGKVPDRFEDIPVLDRTIIAERSAEFFAAGIPEDRRIHLRTSGSTGNPLSFVRDRSQGPLEDISARRFLMWMQGVPTDVTVVWFAAAPPGMPGVHPMPAGDLSPENIAAAAPAWVANAPYVLYGYSSAIDLVAACVEDGLEIPTSPVACIGTGEMFTDAMRERASRAFGCPVHAWYGSQEVGGYLAGTLPGETRFACNPLLGWVEIADGAGEPLHAGERGRILVTDLNNWVFPFIRYDTGDEGIASPTPTGGFPVLEEISGRSSDVLRLANGRVISAVSFGGTVFVKHGLAEFARRFQVAQTGPNALEVRVVWRETPTPTLLARTEEAVREIAGTGCQIRIAAVDDVERAASGKSWIVRREF